MRAVLFAAAFSLMISLFGTPLYIRFLVRKGYGQFIRDDGPTSHHVKRGTPTMGGAVMIGATLLAYSSAHLITWRPPTVSAVLVLFLMTGLGVVGFLDDFIKIRKQRSLGLRARAKFGGQFLVAIVFAVLALQFRNHLGLTPASTHLSYVRDLAPVGLGAIGFVVIAYVIIAATSNAVIRFPKVSSTRSAPSAVTTLPFGNHRSPATTVAVPSGSTRIRSAVATGAPAMRSKPKLPT